MTKPVRYEWLDIYSMGDERHTSGYYRSADIDPLLALIRRPKRIEWKLCKSGTYLGYASTTHDITCKVWEDIDWSFKIKHIGIEDGGYKTEDEAKAACQSAFDAFVEGLTEVVE